MTKSVRPPKGPQCRCAKLKTHHSVRHSKYIARGRPFKRNIRFHSFYSSFRSAIVATSTTRRIATHFFGIGREPSAFIIRTIPFKVRSLLKSIRKKVVNVTASRISFCMENNARAYVYVLFVRLLCRLTANTYRKYSACVCVPCPEFLSPFSESTRNRRGCFWLFLDATRLTQIVCSFLPVEGRRRCRSLA